MPPPPGHRRLAVGVWIRPLGRRVAQGHLQRHPQQRVQVQQPRDLQRVAAVAAARQRRHHQLQVQGRQAQPRADQRVGEDERRVGAVGRGHVLAPRLGDADHQLQRRVHLPGRLAQPVGQAEQLVLAQGQDAGQVAGGADLPGADAPAVAAHHRLDVAAHHPGQAGNVAVPQPQPVRQPARREIDQRAAHDRDVLRLGPLQHLLVRLPVVVRLGRLDLVPGEGHAQGVAALQQRGGQGLGRHGRAEAAAQGRLQARLPRVPHLEDLADVGLHQLVRRPEGEGEGFLGVRAGLGRG